VQNAVRMNEVIEEDIDEMVEEIWWRKFGGVVWEEHVCGGDSVVGIGRWSLMKMASIGVGVVGG
jgi:hypothetical protein